MGISNSVKKQPIKNDTDAAQVEELYKKIKEQDQNGEDTGKTQQILIHCNISGQASQILDEINESFQERFKFCEVSSECFPPERKVNPEKVVQQMIKILKDNSAMLGGKIGCFLLICRIDQDEMVKESINLMKLVWGVNFFTTLIIVPIMSQEKNKISIDEFIEQLNHFADLELKITPKLMNDDNGFQKLFKEQLQRVKPFKLNKASSILAKSSIDFVQVQKDIIRKRRQNNQNLSSCCQLLDEALLFIIGEEFSKKPDNTDTQMNKNVQKIQNQNRLEDSSGSMHMHNKQNENSIIVCENYILNLNELQKYFQNQNKINIISLDEFNSEDKDKKRIKQNFTKVTFIVNLGGDIVKEMNRHNNMVGYINKHSKQNQFIILDKLAFQEEHKHYLINQIKNSNFKYSIIERKENQNLFKQIEESLQNLEK